MVLRSGSAAGLSMKSTIPRMRSTCGRSLTTVLPRPIRKLANTSATSQRPRRNHFSERRNDLLISFFRKRFFIYCSLNVTGAAPSPARGIHANTESTVTVSMRSENRLSFGWSSKATLAEPTRPPRRVSGPSLSVVSS